MLGYVDIDEKGLGGIEYALDDRIRSKPGRMLILADAQEPLVRQQRQDTRRRHERRPHSRRKHSIHRRKGAGRGHPADAAKAGTVIVQDPSNGEILAMANWPTFNPNAPAESKPESRDESRHRQSVRTWLGFQDRHALRSYRSGAYQSRRSCGLPDGCRSTSRAIASATIKRFGLLTVSQILAKSSDVGAIKIGLRLGAPKFYDYIRSYGFGSLTDMDLPGENRGLLRHVENWTPVSVGSISMGQEVGVTPLQMVKAMSAIANGGLLYRPHVVTRLANRSRKYRSRTTDARAEARRSATTTAATMRGMLEGVVLTAPASCAQLDGYTAAGKTGTAQKDRSGDGPLFRDAIHCLIRGIRAHQ